MTSAMAQKCRLCGEKQPLMSSFLGLCPACARKPESRAIAEFIAALDPNIPYSLLAFHPDYLITDLPVTSLKDAEEARAAAKRAGLQNVHIGNIHVLC